VTDDLPAGALLLPTRATESDGATAVLSDENQLALFCQLYTK
jgi:hypothetical protein